MLPSGVPMGSGSPRTICVPCKCCINTAGASFYFKNQAIRTSHSSQTAFHPLLNMNDPNAITPEKDNKNVYNEHVEHAQAPEHTVDRAGDDIGSGLVKSRFDNDGVWATLWRFRLSATYCFALYTAYIMDGFEVTMSGSIIANEGFK